MKISEAQGKLNRRCVIAIKQHGGIFDILSRMNDYVPAYVFSENDRTYLQLYFQKRGRQNNIISPLLSRKDLVEKRSYYSITERVNNVEGMKAIIRLIEAPSVALNDTYLLKNELFLDFRFHSTMLYEINDILHEVIGVNPNFRIVKMTNSRHLRERMEEMNSQTPVAVVRYNVPIPEDNEIMRYMEKNHPDAVGEVEGRLVSENGIKVLLYTSKPVNVKGVDPISPDDCVYESYIFERTLSEGRRMGNRARIPRIAVFYTLEEGRLIDTTFIPAGEADEYISIMMSSLMAEHGSRPLLEYYSELDENVWKLI
ncbi:MAG: hypothetical protein M1597_03440 [Candidatus Thermoplasmatota archaeon]|nr:hypothetical protein [Candidatus Thermoplasmatota archaeon]